MDPDSESKLISLITKPMHWSNDEDSEERPKGLSGIIQIISLVNSLDLESESQPESEFMSLIIQTKSLFNSIDLDSHPKPLSKLISRIVEDVYPTKYDDELTSLYQETIALGPEPELVSLIYRLLSLVSYMVMDSKHENLIYLCPQSQIILTQDNMLYISDGYINPISYKKWKCLDTKGKIFKSGGEGGSSYFYCEACKGYNHERAAYEIKHPLHPKHSLTLFVLETFGRKRKCYCCGENLSRYIFCCLACNYAMNFDCAVKPRFLSIDNPKRHEHPLALFSRTTSLICDVCALPDPTCLVCICAPCGFVVHQGCINLPRVIRISRHPHRISYTSSFNQGRWSCGVCRKGINNDYGGYSCTKNGCSYAAHSKCATQSNVWDGIELDGVPEDDIEDMEPFVRISDGIIQHFTHEHHHLRLDENTDEDKLCEACVTPIYFGNLYACTECDFVLHEECANLPRRMYHPIHPHALALMRKDGDIERGWDICSACPWQCTTGFFYVCQSCQFEVHVKCAVISEPLIHSSHTHPLFLTSKPGERRDCSICKESTRYSTNETFNCIECDFSLCFRCATLPQKVRYKHDKHTFILSYAKETSALASSWCEVCERKIDTRMGFYTCSGDCCVTLHISCTIGYDLYLKPGASWSEHVLRVDVLQNKQKMSRPICFQCKRRCPRASLVLSYGGGYFLGEFCSTICMFRRHYSDFDID